MGGVWEHVPRSGLRRPEPGGPGRAWGQRHGWLGHFTPQGGSLRLAQPKKPYPSGSAAATGRFRGR